MSELLRERIRRLRYQAGMTQRAMAKALGVSSVAVSDWETRGHGFAPQRTNDIARVLGVTPEYLLHGSEDRYEALVAAIRRTTTDPHVLALVEGR